MLSPDKHVIISLGAVIRDALWQSHLKICGGLKDREVPLIAHVHAGADFRSRRECLRPGRFLLNAIRKATTSNWQR